MSSPIMNYDEEKEQNLGSAFPIRMEKTILYTLMHSNDFECFYLVQIRWPYYVYFVPFNYNFTL